MATFEDIAHVAEFSVEDKTSRIRMHEIVSICRKHHILTNLTPDVAVAVLEELGPVYVKLGQLASSRSDVLPKDYCDAFERLRDDASPMTFQEVEEQLKCGLPQSALDKIFLIEEKPLGAASIAQVHEAMLITGDIVAIKVRRPGIVEQMDEDMMLMKHLVAVARLFVHKTNASTLNMLAGFINEIERTSKDETDFTTECEHLQKFADEIKDQEGITSPRSYPELSSSSVLTMEYISGKEITDVSLPAHFDMTFLADRAIQSYVSQVLDYGFFHADPHPGNILVKSTGEIAWIDLGMVGVLSASQRKLVFDVFASVYKNDPYLLREACLSLSVRRGDVNQGTLLEDLSFLLDKYATATMKDINIGIILAEVMDLLHAHALEMTPSIAMLVRGFVSLEGVVAEISPNTSIMEIVSGYVLRQEMSPDNVRAHLRNFVGALAGSTEKMVSLPTKISNTLDTIDKGQLEVKSSIDASDKVLATIYAAVGRLSLALLSVGLFLGSSIICTTAMKPEFLGVPLLGFLGYIGAAVLGGYTIWRIIVSRHRMLNDEKPE